MSDLFETEIVAWSKAEALSLRRLTAGEAVNDQVDWRHIVNEVETLAGPNGLLFAATSPRCWSI